MMNDLRKVAQEQSTDTKSAIGGTRMSEAATPAVAAGNRVSTTRIVGAAAIALAASVVIDNTVVSWGRNDNLRGPDQGGARLPRGEPGRGRDRGRPGGADPAAAALVRDRSPRDRRAPRGCGRGLVAPRGGRRRDLFGGDG